MNTTTEMSSSKTIVIKRKKPVVAPLDASMIASDDKPDTLPPATLKAFADADARGELLEEVDCYWCPPELTELFTLRDYFESVNIYDFRKRSSSTRLISLNEAEIATFKAKEIEIKKAYDELSSIASKARNAYYDEYRKNNFKENEATLALKKESEKTEKDAREKDASLTNTRIYITRLENANKSIKEWRPSRRVVACVYYNQHKVEKILETLDGKKTAFGNKLAQVVRMRDEMMKEENKKRGNPMRSVEWCINLTPMDYRVQASWTVSRNEHNDYSGGWITHYLHLTEYNLKGEDAVEYKSKEQLLHDEEEANKKRLAGLKKKVYDNYFYMYNIKSVLKECNLDSVVCDEDFTDITTFTGEKKKYNPISSFVVGNVNLTTHTFTIIGYLKDDKYKKAKTPLALTYPAPKSKACKTTQLQKDLKKLTMNYEVVE